MASYYGEKFRGRPTASGEIFDPDQMTAAHKTLAFGTVVKVTRVDNGKSVTVRINDRGPFVEGRIIDLAEAAARKIDMIAAGVVKVRVEVTGGNPDF
jgi:rare lipoprotein A